MGAAKIYVLLVSERPAVQAFFQDLEQGLTAYNQQFGHDPRPFVVSRFSHFQVLAEALSGRSQGLDHFAEAVTTAPRSQVLTT